MGSFTTGCHLVRNSSHLKSLTFLVVLISQFGQVAQAQSESPGTRPSKDAPPKPGADFYQQPPPVIDQDPTLPKPMGPPSKDEESSTGTPSSRPKKTSKPKGKRTQDAQDPYVTDSQARPSAGSEARPSESSWRANPSIRILGGGLAGVDRTINVITGAVVDPAINRLTFGIETFLPNYAALPALNGIGVGLEYELWLPVAIAVRRENNQRVGNAKVNERTLAICPMFAPIYGKTVRQQIKLKVCPTTIRRQVVDFDDPTIGQSQVTFVSQSPSGSVDYGVMLFPSIVLHAGIASTFGEKVTVTEDAGASTFSQDGKWRRTDYRGGATFVFEGKLSKGFLQFTIDGYLIARRETAALDQKVDTDSYTTPLYGTMFGVGYIP